MESPRNVHIAHRPARTRAWLSASAAAIAGGCLLIAGCGAGSSSSAASAEAAPAGVHMAAGRAAAAAPVKRAALAGLPALAGQDIIYTTSLTVRTANVSQAASRASQVAEAAGGYVAAENSALDRARPAASAVTLQLKVPVGAYQGTLSSLSALGTRLSVSARAQDVTQTVADVASRVTSAQTAIGALRTLLNRAGSVASLLTVQNQVNEEESSLEALQAQQRALSHETAFATVNLLLVGKPRPAVKKHHAKHLGGFTGGLTAGWHGLRLVVSLLLTGIGAALPFAAILALAGYLAYRGRRWLMQRRAPSPAGSSAAD